MNLQFNPRSGYIRIDRMAWNLNTQKRHLKHTDEPPEDCGAWEPYASHVYGTLYEGRGYGAPEHRVNGVLEGLLAMLEREPNRWFRVAIYGTSGFERPDGKFFADGEYDNWRKPLVIMGPFCKEKGVMPELVVNSSGLYEFPFNLPDGIFDSLFDPAKPEFGEEAKPTLDAVAVDPGTEIVILDDWGLPVTTTEVV